MWVIRRVDSSGTIYTKYSGPSLSSDLTASQIRSCGQGSLSYFWIVEEVVQGGTETGLDPNKDKWGVAAKGQQGLWVGKY